MIVLVLFVVVAGGSFALACVGTRLLIPLLRRRAVLDRPNERSSHLAPTPRGGGIAPVASILLVWLGLCAIGLMAPATVLIILGAAMLAVVSWVDDVRGLSPAVRLVAQFMAVLAGAWLLPPWIFQGWLPPILDTLATALVWVWFINLFNFMDGIDGIAGSEAAAIGIGIAVVGGFGTGAYLSMALPAVAIAAAAIGFLVWNWAPAKIFLGDVGSIPLGYLLGLLLLELAAQRHWQAALILPLYFLADASLTLLRRLIRRERVWQAHRQHFYQRAVQLGLGHAAVVRRVIAADLVLIVCAGAAENGYGFAGLGVAVLTVVLLLAALGRAR
jgi:UDP-N-acetylmuramyl pentapeptide phosphotransferase/UDP-N-acetylglucosamine-1-phosphate transferase